MAERPRALITGISGQDGSYLAELLVRKGYDVHGLIQAAPADMLPRISDVREHVTLHWGDLVDEASVGKVIRRVQPDEVYNLAAAAYVPTSFEQPALTANVTGVGVTRMLQATLEWAPHARFLQASSSEIFGHADVPIIDEHTPLRPRNPYGAAKAYGHMMVTYFREATPLQCCAAISFNHESPRRGLEYVSRKVTRGVAAIKLGLAETLRLGNLEARRDWGFAPEYVEAMWLMLQQPEVDDYVLATGTSHSVRDLAEIAFTRVGLNWEDWVQEDPAFTRPTDIPDMVGNASKARTKLGWTPETSFSDLIELMVDADLELLSRTAARGGEHAAASSGG